MSGGIVTGEPAPTGTIVPYAGDISAIPSDWLLCDGSLQDRVTFAALNTILNDKFGAGDAGNFVLPDLRAVFPRGAPAATEAGDTGGDDAVTLTQPQLPAHNHPITDPGHTHDVPATLNAGSVKINNNLGDSSTQNVVTLSKVTGITVDNMTGGGSSHENRPVFLQVQYIIKI